MLRKFAEDHRAWLAAVEAMAELDALMSLAIAAASGDGDMCRRVLSNLSLGCGLKDRTRV